MNKHKYTNLININAESIGIRSLDNEIIDYLNIEIEEKIKSILSQAKKFMRVSKRKTLKVDDLNHSLKFFNFKPLLGYDSYANAEYERIESVNGLWRPKQNIIDLEDYLSKPIVSCPMQAFPHFHWVAIEGKRPNIPENFIREEYKIEHKEKEVSIIPADINVNQQFNINAQIMQVNMINITASQKGALPPGSIQGGAKVVPPVIHNISKELQIFLENFEQRFRKEIKMSKLNPFPLFSMSKELQISLNVIETEPGVVELLPYILEFLMNNLSNKQYVKDPKVHMVILHYVNAILNNPYFYLEPYLHQMVTLLLSLILMENTGTVVDLVVSVKDYAIKILKTLYTRFEIKYPNFIHQLLDVFKDQLLPNTSNPSFLTVYGAIKSINTLGPTYIIDIILPKIDQILSSLYSDAITPEDKNLAKSKFYFDDKSANPSQGDLMLVDQPYSQITESIPKINFSLPPITNTIPISSSIFSEISNTNVINFKKDSKIVDVNDDKVLMNLLKNKKNFPMINKKAFYVHYALKESATLILNYSSGMDSKFSKEVFEKLTDTFGETILPNLLNDSKISANVDLDLFL